MLLCNQQQFKKKLLHEQHKHKLLLRMLAHAAPTCLETINLEGRKRKKWDFSWGKINSGKKPNSTDAHVQLRYGHVYNQEEWSVYVCVRCRIFRKPHFWQSNKGKRCQITILGLSWPIVTTLISAQIFTRVSCGHDYGENYVIQGSVGRSSYQKMFKIN